MKSFIVSIALVFSFGAGVATADTIRCGYTAEGNYDSADGGNAGVPESQWNLKYAIPSPHRATYGTGPEYVIILHSDGDLTGNDCPEAPVEVRK